MTDGDPESLEHLEEARGMVCDALHTLEEAQRVLFRAGDCYVTGVWGDGVRAVIEITERMTALVGDLTSVPLEIDRLSQRDRGRSPDRPPSSR